MNCVLVTRKSPTEIGIYTYFYFSLSRYSKKPIPTSHVPSSALRLAHHTGSLSPYVYSNGSSFVELYFSVLYLCYLYILVRSPCSG